MISITATKGSIKSATARPYWCCTSARKFPSLPLWEDGNEGNDRYSIDERSGGRRAAAARDMTRAVRHAFQCAGIRWPAAWPVLPRSRPTRSGCERRSIATRFIAPQPHPRSGFLLLSPKPEAASAPTRLRRIGTPIREAPRRPYSVSSIFANFYTSVLKIAASVRELLSACGYFHGLTVSQGDMPDYGLSSAVGSVEPPCVGRQGVAVGHCHRRGAGFDVGQQFSKVAFAFEERLSHAELHGLPNMRPVSIGGQQDHR